MNIKTINLQLRRFNKSDAHKCYYNFGQDEESGRYLPMFPMKSVEEMQKYIDGYIGAEGENSFTWLIEKRSSGEPVGFVSVEIPYRELNIGEISYLLGRKYQGKGYAYEAVSAILKYMFNTQDLYMIEAKYNANNIASGKLLKKLGFFQECELRDRRLDCIDRIKCNLVICSLKKDEFI